MTAWFPEVVPWRGFSEVMNWLIKHLAVHQEAYKLLKQYYLRPFKRRDLCRTIQCVLQWHWRLLTPPVWTPLNGFLQNRCLQKIASSSFFESIRFQHRQEIWFCTISQDSLLSDETLLHEYYTLPTENKTTKALSQGRAKILCSLLAWAVAYKSIRKTLAPTRRQWKWYMKTAKIKVYTVRTKYDLWPSEILFWL